MAASTTGEQASTGGLSASENAPVLTTPIEALSELMAGNRRFVAGRPRYGHVVSNAAAVASGTQTPYAVVLGCIDSRVPLEAVFDQNFGSMCVVRSGGHALDRAVLGSVQFAVAELKVPLVVVLGHERCGAVAATVAALRTGREPGGALAFLVDEIAPAVHEAGLLAPDVHTRAVRLHVRNTVGRLSELATAAGSAGPVNVVGAVYDLDTSRVELLR